MLPDTQEYPVYAHEVPMHYAGIYGIPDFSVISPFSAGSFPLLNASVGGEQKHRLQCCLCTI